MAEIGRGDVLPADGDGVLRPQAQLGAGDVVRQEQPATHVLAGLEEGRRRLQHRRLAAQVAGADEVIHQRLLALPVVGEGEAAWGRSREKGLQTAPPYQGWPGEATRFGWEGEERVSCGAGALADGRYGNITDIPMRVHPGLGLAPGVQMGDARGHQCAAWWTSVGAGLRRRCGAATPGRAVLPSGDPSRRMSASADNVRRRCSNAQFEMARSAKPGFWPTYPT